MSSPLPYKLKFISMLPFACGATECPKFSEVFNVGILSHVRQPASRDFRPDGCSQYKTQVWGVSSETLSLDEWAQTELISCILPSPDPSGILGVGNGVGFSRDLVIDCIWRARKKPFRIAFMFLTRGYSVKGAYRGELLQGAVSSAAITNCLGYLKRDIAALKPSKILMCGFEPGNTFFQDFDTPTYRRRYGLSIEVEGVKYPVTCTFSPYQCGSAPSYIAAIREDCMKLFLNKIPGIKNGKTRLLMTLEEVLDYLDYLSEFEGYIGLDYETENLHRKAGNKLGTLQFSTSGEEGVVIPYQHRQTPFSPQELNIIRKRLVLFFSRKIKAQGFLIHYAKFEQTITRMHFGTFIKSATVIDLMAGAYLLDETRSERKGDKPKGFKGLYGLKILSYDYLNFDGYDRGVLQAREEGSLLDLDLAELADYGAMDAWIMHHLWDAYLVEAARQKYLAQFLRLLEKFYDPITRLVSYIEMTGFKLDLTEARRLSANKGPFQIRLNELEDKFKQMKHFQKANLEVAKRKNAGNPEGVWGTPWVLDLSKPDHKKIVFVDVMGLETPNLTDKTNQPSIDDDFFEEYKATHEEVNLFSQYEETKKMRDSFIIKLLERVDPETGDPDCKIDQKIRPSIQYANLVTGRFAMSKPNLQQVPKAEEEDAEPGQLQVKKAVKDLFTVDDGCGLLQIDYRVNEVRWVAILAQEPYLAQVFTLAAQMEREAIASGDPELLKKASLYADVHRGTASAMFQIPVEQVSKKQRQIAKAITFGLLYGQGAQALADSVGITLEEAEAHIANFFQKLPRIAAWITRMKETAALQGFVESPHGRRRRLWGFSLPDSYPMKRAKSKRSERQSTNSPIQGIASDASMLGGGCSLLDYIEETNAPWKILNVVHDSVLVQTPINETAKCIRMAQSIFVDRAMERMTQDFGINFNLPLAIDVEAGHTKWGSLIKWDGTEKHAVELEAAVNALYEDR